MCEYDNYTEPEEQKGTTNKYQPVNPVAPLLCGL
jgi:hypothetical protein